MTVGTASGPDFRFGTSETLHSSEANTPSLGWGQGGSNEPGQPVNETPGGGGEIANHGWGMGETTNADSSWGVGETANTGGGWGVGETTNADSGWGAGETNTNSGWGGGDGGIRGWGSTGGWASSGNVSGSGGGGWGLSNKNDAAADRTQSTAQKEAADANPPVATSSDNAWGSSSTAWGSSNTWGSSGWGSSNNTWTTPNETAQDEPASHASPDKGKGKGRETGGQSGGWSGWHDTSNSDTAAGLHLSGGGGWGSSTPSVPTAVGVTQGSYLESYPLRIVIMPKPVHSRELVFDLFVLRLYPRHHSP